MEEHSNNHNQHQGDNQHTHTEHTHETHHHNASTHHEQHHHTDRTEQGAHHHAASKLKAHAGALEAMLVPIFASIPHLPEDWGKFITKIIPILSLVFGTLGLIGLIGVGALGAIFSPMIILGKGFIGILFFITLLCSLATSILSIMAYKPLQAVKKQGWNYLFYALVISTVSTALSLLGMYGGVGSIVMILISSYIVFEIRERYH